MRVLVDTSLTLNLFANRDGFVDVGERLIVASRSSSIELYVTERCLETIRFYIGKQNLQLAEDIITQIRMIFNDRVIPVTSDLINQAFSLSIQDLEVALEVTCATTQRLSAIVTQNIDKYHNSMVPAWTIDGLFNRQSLEKLVSEPSKKEQSGDPQQIQELIQRIAEADTDDFFELAKLAGLSPTEDFSGADLKNVDLSYGNLIRANFVATDLSDAILIQANLESAHLTGAFLVSAILTGANLDDARLVSANLTGANLIGASLKNTDLTRATLATANLSHVDLRRAKLTAATLCEACLSEATLSHAALRRADLSRTDLSGASLYGADLSNCDLRRANLTDVNLTGASVVRALFGDNPGLSKEAMVDLSNRGALFSFH